MKQEKQNLKRSQFFMFAGQFLAGVLMIKLLPERVSHFFVPKLRHKKHRSSVKVVIHPAAVKRSKSWIKSS